MMKFKLTIETEMTTGHKFQDVIYMNEYDNVFIEEFIFGKAAKRGFKTSEVYDYSVTITNNI